MYVQFLRSWAAGTRQYQVGRCGQSQRGSSTQLPNYEEQTTMSCSICESFREDLRGEGDQPFSFDNASSRSPSGTTLPAIE